MRIDRTERLLNLVFCLMAARRSVSRSAIKNSIPGYASDQGDAAFERMFERDKEELRGMGIPIETVLDADGDVEGYRIPAERYELPAIAFSPRELSVIALAASVWDHAILGPVANNALRKIEAAEGTAATAADDLRMSVQLTASDAALMPMLQAVRDRRPTSFSYQGAADPAAIKRRIDPWGVIAENGRWYVVGYDHDRAAPRAFRLSRIVGSVSVSAGAISHERPAEFDLRALVTGAGDDGPASARVRVDAGRGARLRRLCDAQTPAFETVDIDVSADSSERLIASICSAGSGAQVLSPVQVRSAVLERLERVASMHGGVS